MSAIRNELVDKYTVLAYEYLHIMNASDVIKHIENQVHVIQIGFLSINHIYKLSFFLSKNVATAVCHCQKGMYCYLEYIEQMNKTNALHNLDQVDAVVFIYEKTLAEIYGHTMSNILSVSDTVDGSDFIRCNRCLDVVTHLAFCLLWFENSKLDRCSLVETHLHPLAALFSDYSLDVLIPFIECVQEKMAPFEHAEYDTFLFCLAKHIKRAIKHQQIPTKQEVDECCLQLHAYYRGKTIQQIELEEGAKHALEDLVKLVIS
jgi:hypothetical protein